MSYTNIETIEEFKKHVYNTNKVLIINFWAPWCGPCKSFAPIYQKIAIETPEIEFFKINTQISQDIAQEFNIQSIPATFIIQNQNIIDSKLGYIPKEELKDWINQYLG